METGVWLDGNCPSVGSFKNRLVFFFLVDIGCLKIIDRLFGGLIKLFKLIFIATSLVHNCISGGERKIILRSRIFCIPNDAA